MHSEERKDVFNLKLLNSAPVGFYQFPEVSPCFHSPAPGKVVSFNYARSCPAPKEYYVHFYIDDYQFERVWRKPERYTKMLSRFAGVIGPDFSIYQDMPKAQQIWQIYRQRLLTAYWQQCGLRVIPNVSWSDESSFEWVFDGLPKNSVIALSSNGCLNKNTLPQFLKGYTEAQRVLAPMQTVFIGEIPEPLRESRGIINFSGHLEKFKK